MTAPETYIETIRVRGGRAPLLDRHEGRLRRSGVSAPALGELIAPHLVRGDAAVRVTVASTAREVTPRPVPPARPMRLIVATTRHTPYPRKTTARAAFDAALQEAQQAGADDAVLLTAKGIVAEGTVWSLFWWEGDGLGTPPLSLGILPGVGRDRVSDLVSVTERTVQVDELRSKSLFAINAVRGVIEIASFEGMTVPQDARTAELGARFWP